MARKRKHPASEWDNPRNKPAMPASSAIEAAGHEMKENPPRILAHTRKKFGKKRAKKQRIAIMLAKARRGE